MAGVRKVILDTDIGSHLDDELCLAYLLAQPRCDLLGVTTVSGRPVERAWAASVHCAFAGRADVPVLPGIADPLSGPQRQPDVFAIPEIASPPPRVDLPEGAAIEWMRDTIRANPGEVTLLAIGPLTNLAALFALDPDIPALLEAVVLMGGAIRHPPYPGAPSPFAEWNVLCDAPAADVVFRSRPPRLRAYGVDVTLQVIMPADEFRSRAAAAPALGAVLDSAQRYLARGDATVRFHDPLAAAAIFDDSFVEHERGHVEVELESHHLTGVTNWTPDPDGPVEFATAVDRAAALRELFARF